MPDSNVDSINPFFSTSLFGLEKYFGDLFKLYKIRKLPKVVLLSGDKGSGKFTLSFHLINHILSLETNKLYDTKNFKINTESEVYKSILSNVNDNFYYLGNEDNKTKTSIENIRNLKEKFNKSTLNNKPRFTILDDVELLNLNSANAILKLIEEPSVYDYFFLIFSKKQNIIETIKSRALEIKIFFSKQEKKNIYKNLLTEKKITEEFFLNQLEYYSPGTLINFFYYLNKVKFKENDNFFKTSVKLIDLYKKNKKIIYLDCVNFLLNISSPSNHNIENKIKIMKLLNQYRKFNLSNNIILDNLNEYSNHVR
tara:strand:- start:612 stop:1544 length:933 start_codon:yes stop_codon:yes gene_type:complete